ncbi:phosphatidylserine decarboxylase, partial [Escherichia coli]|nr:phosphatidylserine decarboxylase [Escherichia coli]
PADACVSQFGPIEDGQLIQAKGHNYSAQELLGGDEKLAEAFKDGSFATLYLSPRDYHRVHMPCDGTLRQMIYVPGD